VSDTPAVAVVVVHWEAPAWATDTVASIARSEGVDLRILVVHNGGPVPELPADVELLDAGQNLGFAGGANEGVRAVAPEAWVLVTSHDLELDPSALIRMVEAGNRRPTAGIVGPHFEAGASNGRPGPVVAGLDAGVESRSWISGSCMLIRTRCFEELGGFDDRLGSYCEDVDLCRRAWSRGWEVLAVPSAIARATGSALDPGDKYVMMTGNGIAIDAKDGRTLAVAGAVVGLLLRSAAAALTGRRRVARLHLRALARARQVSRAMAGARDRTS
jgi:GT2 family glycosyltransferase